MEPQVVAEELGIRIYTASPRAAPPQPNPSSAPACGPETVIPQAPPPPLLPYTVSAGPGGKKRRAAVAINACTFPPNRNTPNIRNGSSFNLWNRAVYSYQHRYASDPPLLMYYVMFLLPFYRQFLRC